MAKYAAAECRECHQILTKNLMHEVNEQVITGRSGSSFGFFGGTRRDAKGNESGSFSGSRWNTGRTYYAYRTCWYCETCFQIRRQRRARRAIAAIAVVFIGFLVVLGVATDNSGSEGFGDAPASTDAGSAMPASAQTPANAIQASTAVENTSIADRPSMSESSPTPAAALQDTKQLTNSVDATVQDAPSAPVASSDPSTPGEAAAPIGNIAAEENNPASIQSQVPLRYPVDAMRNQEHGEVIIDASITADGIVQSATVEQSSGYRSLDAAAVSSVLQWRFNPAKRDGKSVATSIRIPINFAPPALR